MRDRVVHLAGVEPLDFCRRDRRAENPEHRPGVKAARHHARDEFRRHALHDFVAGGDAGQERLARSAARLGGGERRRQDRGAGMGQHAERVPLAAGEDRLGIDKGGPGLGQFRAMAQHGRRPAAARLFLPHQSKRLPARRHVVRHERRRQRLQRHTLGPIDHRRRQLFVGQIGDEGGEFTAQRHDCPLIFQRAVSRAEKRSFSLASGPTPAATPSPPAPAGCAACRCR